MWVEWNTFLFQIVVYHVCHGRRERLFSRTKLLQKQKGEKNVVRQAFVLCSCVKLVFLGYGSGMKHSKAKLINSSILITVYMLAFTSLLTLLCHSHIQLPILTSITVLLTVLPSYLRLSSPENINFTSLIYVFCLQIGSTSLHDDTAEDPIMNGRVEIEPTINKSTIFPQKIPRCVASVAIRKIISQVCSLRGLITCEIICEIYLMSRSIKGISGCQHEKTKHAWSVKCLFFFWFFLKGL